MSHRKFSRFKKRFSKKAKLIYCEGFHEEIFLKFLSEIYRSSKASIRIRSGKGGSADQIVQDAVNAFGDFRKKIVILDIDKPKREIERARKIAKDNSIKLIENFPCLEGVFLSVLIENKEFINQTSEWCKKHFHANYVSEGDRDDTKKYLKIFPKKLLDIKRKTVKALNMLISAVEEK
jgi:hypothetical protein